MKIGSSVVVLVALGLAVPQVTARAGQDPGRSPEEARIIRGYQINPVPLKIGNRDRNLVGLGSYLVNSAGGCNDCHTNPPFAPGGDPFAGEPKKINADAYLGGGQEFGPFVSPNLTPDASGKPAGLTLQQFKRLMRTGIDPEDGELLQVMPWPGYGDMTDHDLEAIYAYLKSIPSLD